MKKNRVFYFTGFILITIAAFIPSKELVKLCINSANSSLVAGFANENYIIPFAGVVLSLLFGYLLLPFVAKKYSPKKSKILLSIVATGLFIIISLFTESMSAKQHRMGDAPSISGSAAQEQGPNIPSDSFAQNMLSKRYFIINRKLIAAYTPEYLGIEIPSFGEEVICIAVDGTYIFRNSNADSVVDSRAQESFNRSDTFYYYDTKGPKIPTKEVSPLVMMTRSGAMVIPEEIHDELDTLTIYETKETVFASDGNSLYSGQFRLDKEYIPPAVKMHYYIFSIILVASLLCFLSDVYFHLYSLEKRKNAKLLIVQGLSVVFYALAYFLVKPINYIHFNGKLITMQSAISALLCIVFAGVSAGFYTANIVQSENKKRVIPSLVASLTVILLYIAEYIMLGGRLYLYGNNWFFGSIPYLPLSPANLVVIATPAIIVSLVLRLIYREK